MSPWTTDTYREQGQSRTRSDGADRANPENKHVHPRGIAVESKEGDLHIGRIQLLLENLLLVLGQMRKDRIVI
jgi:hypothetical protein